ncbi:hypothetical protein AVEN_233372-1 [Araneus ventricosus]|uniref:Uncharacterized protein n=1 Tax=Araneus ventricosus TaxID=182803 RepID=A0A4Y2L0K7_ARAVE|nr:hypothetical protein AVEN_233372-1 [Araneus ventricosus]
MDSPVSEKSSAQYSVALGGQLVLISCKPDIPFSLNKFSYVYESNSLGCKVKQFNDSRAEGGALERKCLGDFYTGAQWNPVEKNCTDVQSQVTMTLYELAKTNITEDNILNSTKSMEMLTTSSEQLSSTDVQYVAQILRNVANIPAVEPEEMEGRYKTQNSVQPLCLLGFVPPRISDRDPEHWMGIRLHGGRHTPALLHAGFVLLDARGSLPALHVFCEGPRDLHSSLSAESDVVCLGCWLSGDVFYIAVAFPVSASLVINFMVFGVIFYSLTCGESKQKLKHNQEQRRDMVVRAKTMFCVSLLLGLSWVFGFLAAMEETKLVCHYLFVITTTLQGFLFFVFFVLRQKNTRELWQNLVKTTSTPGSSQPIGLKEL